MRLLSQTFFCKKMFPNDMTNERNKRFQFIIEICLRIIVGRLELTNYNLFVKI